MLVESLIKITDEWKDVFPQERTYLRSSRNALTGLTTLGRRTVSRSIWSGGRENLDWSGDYYLFSRSPWNIRDIFNKIVHHTLQYSYDDYIAIGWDETKIKKTGRKIPGVSYQRDPLSPPFHTNFILGHRYLQASALLGLHQNYNVSSRGIPVDFSMIQKVKKPLKKAPEDEWKAYEEERKKYNMSTHFVKRLGIIRQSYDFAGAKEKNIVAVGDGSFCNRTVFSSKVEKTIILTRCRKDLSLCFRAKGNSKKFYGDNKFSPEAIRRDESICWDNTKIFHGKRWRDVDYKEVKNVLWQRGAKRKMLRLIVIRPVPYRTTKKGRVYYRQPAYLLCDDNQATVKLLIQMYFDRWQIEVNHREEKDTLGIGEAQVWSKKSVEREPAFRVAVYSALLLATLNIFGTNRTVNYMPLPRWRKNAERPSCLDLITLLRRELVDKPEITYILGINTDANKLISCADA